VVTAGPDVVVMLAPVVRPGGAKRAAMAGVLAGLLLAVVVPAGHDLVVPGRGLVNTSGRARGGSFRRGHLDEAPAGPQQDQRG
jgi:hypothetical protein